MTSIAFDNVSKEFTPGEAAVNNVSLEIESGEFFVLVGPSGCGKTTLLRMVAGLEQPTSGTIRIGDEDVTRLAPRERDTAMVFQNYAIYPHMTVGENMGYGLKVRGIRKGEVRSRVEEVAQLLGLHALLDRRPSTLSGGQLQRVAIGRAIAREPSVYLMDEPLSNLDAKLRVSMRAELGALHRRLGVTTVYVTHDQVEAMTLGERAAVLREGVVQQVDTPQRLYDRPASAFVARFIGSPPTNFAVGTCTQGRLSFGGIDLPLPEQLRPPCSDEERVLVGVRPDDLREPRFAHPGSTKFEVKVTVREDLGFESLLFFTVPAVAADHDAICRATFEDTPVGNGAAPETGIDPFAMHCARVSAKYSGQPGDVVLLTIAPESLHFFDIDGGKRLAIPADRPSIIVSTADVAG